MFKIEKDFVYRGYRCVVIFTDMGHRCGYVGVDENSSLWKKDYYDYLPINKSKLEWENFSEESEDITVGIHFDVHGGITFADGGKNSEYPVESDFWWFGFDCAHYNDKIDIEKLKEYFPNSKLNETRINLYSNFSSGEVRTLDYVMDECKNLVDQIIEFEN